MRLPGVTKSIGNKSGRIMPSVVRFVEDENDDKEEKDPLVGFLALITSSKEQSNDINSNNNNNSSSLLRSVKRLLGKRYEDLDPAWIETLDFDIRKPSSQSQPRSVVDEDEEEDTSSLQLVVRVVNNNNSSKTKTVTTTPQQVLSIELKALRKSCQAYLDRYRVKKNLRVPGVVSGKDDKVVAKNEKSSLPMIDNVIVGVPAHYSQRHIVLVKEACRDAGFNGYIGTCLESTAAAVAYGLTLQERSKQQQQSTGGGPTIMVVDMGGGTTDITIATSRKSDNNSSISDSSGGGEGGSGSGSGSSSELSSTYRVLVTQGDDMLGGDDIDEAIMIYCQYQLSQLFQHQQSRREMGNNKNEVFRSACRKAKESLCRVEDPSPSETIFVDCDDDANRNIVITQDIFENIIIEPWLRRARDLILQARDDLNEVNNASSSTSDIDTDAAAVTGIVIEEVILVGGTTRIRAIRRMIQEMFPGIELSTSLDPMSSVAQGLAIQAAIASKQVPLYELKNCMMLDCIPHAIGVQLDNRFIEIIPRNTLLTAIGSATFILANKYQAGITIRAVEQVDADTYEPMSKEDFTFLLRKLSPTQFENMSERTIQVGMKVDKEGRFIVSIFDENDPEQVRKKDRFEKIKKGEEVVGELDYIKEMILAESDITNEQITLIVALVSVVVLYIAVKMVFADPLEDGSSVLG
jgi:molecular chaperone DnaK (HSP70)